MNAYDKAHELARALRESGEFGEMKSAKARVDAEAEAKRMLEDFRSRQMRLQERMMAGDMPPAEEMEGLQKQYEVLNLNPAIRSLFDAERRLSVLMEDIQRILAEPLQSVFD